jgi:hypothetical protein
LLWDRGCRANEAGGSLKDPDTCSLCSAPQDQVKVMGPGPDLAMGRHKHNDTVPSRPAGNTFLFIGGMRVCTQGLPVARWQSTLK